MNDDSEAPGPIVISEEVREWQRQFAEQWGPDLTSMLVDTYGFNPSPDGQVIGIEFMLVNGQTLKASMPISWFQQFGREMVLAVETAAERLQAGEAPPSDCRRAKGRNSESALYLAYSRPHPLTS